MHGIHGLEYIGISWHNYKKKPTGMIFHNQSESNTPFHNFLYIFIIKHGIQREKLNAHILVSLSFYIILWRGIFEYKHEKICIYLC